MIIILDEEKPAIYLNDILVNEYSKVNLQVELFINVDSCVHYLFLLISFHTFR